MKDLRKKFIKKAKRIVVKVGSAVVASGGDGTGGIFSRLADEIDEIRRTGRDVVIVSSGAIALGIEKLGIKGRPISIPERQAVAAVGQGSLMSRYEAAFSERGMRVAQVLLTHDDLGSRKRFLNARNTLLTLLGLGIVPIVNENDTVAVEEIKFGDNDELSALTTNLMEADLLVILSDIDGLFDRDPKKEPGARKIPLVEDVDGLRLDAFDSSAGRLGTGGIRSKIEAARKAAHFGAATVIANGNIPGILTGILGGDDHGTLFLPREDRLTSKKHWIAFSTRPSGRLFVDEGAKEAVIARGKSLLPSGIKGVDGTFDAGEVVHCVDAGGMEFARGVSNYSSAEIARIKGLKTKEVEAALGYKVYDEVIHRDNLVVL
ncbi:MAG: glutamate 5-kinase [Deltaproteobacteria bacterium]|nr:glutamate 5-kinase [Deltaproteobacteria bacterium]